MVPNRWSVTRSLGGVVEDEWMPMPLDPDGRLPIQALAAHMAATLGVAEFGAGDFVRQMIETAELVSFLHRV